MRRRCAKQSHASCSSPAGSHIHMHTAHHARSASAHVHVQSSHSASAFARACELRPQRPAAAQAQLVAQPKPVAARLARGRTRRRRRGGGRVTAAAVGSAVAVMGREAMAVAAAAETPAAVREEETAVVVRVIDETGGRTGGWGGRSADSGGRRVEDGEDEGAGRGMRGGRGERGERGGWRHTTTKSLHALAGRVEGEVQWAISGSETGPQPPSGGAERPKRSSRRQGATHRRERGRVGEGLMRAGSGEWGGFGGASSRTVGSGHQAYLQTWKNSTSYSRTPPFLGWKSAPEVGPERSGAADNQRLRAKASYVSTSVQGGRCRTHADPVPLT